MTTWASPAASLSATPSGGSGSEGIPLELDVAAVVVQHGDELLILFAAQQEPIPTDALEELTRAAVHRARW